MTSKFKIISGQELQKEINIIDYIGDLCGNSLYVDKVIYVDGDLEIEGDFTLKQSNELDSRADFMFIKGNLIINGDMNPLEETFPNILVLGNMIANNIQNGEELLMVNGNVTVKNLLYGSYTHGGLKVNGTVTAKYVIKNKHIMLLPNINASYIINPHANEVNVEYDPLPYNLFKKDLLDKLSNEYLTQIEVMNWETNAYEAKTIVDIDKLVVAIKQQTAIF